MLYSEDRKFVFVAVPKTGTTSIQSRLCEVDHRLRRNWVHDAAGALVKVRTHATALEIRRIMGARAKEFTFIAVLRDPRDVLVSKYHFYRSGRAAKKHGLVQAKWHKYRDFQFGSALRVLSAQILPLSIWVRFYPFPSTASYVTDDEGNLIVDRFCTIENLQEDVMHTFKYFGYTPDELQLSIANRTQYKRTRYPKIAAIAERRFATDCALFDRIREERLRCPPS
ncbi:MAG: hypothetical protein ACJA09_000898 [Alcanivorax sp.]|jgi:hypothetical protein